MTFIAIRTDALLSTPTTTACSWTFANGNASNQAWGTFTLILPTTGHYVVGFTADGSHANAGFGVDFTFVLAGTAGVSLSQKTDSINNNGTTHFHGGYIGHGEFTAGQTITLQLLASFVSATGGTATGTIFAHFVPTPAHPF